MGTPADEEIESVRNLYSILVSAISFSVGFWVVSLISENSMDESGSLDPSGHEREKSMTSMLLPRKTVTRPVDRITTNKPYTEDSKLAIPIGILSLSAMSSVVPLEGKLSTEFIEAFDITEEQAETVNQVISETIGKLKILEKRNASVTQVESTENFSSGDLPINISNKQVFVKIGAFELEGANLRDEALRKITEAISREKGEVLLSMADKSLCSFGKTERTIGFREGLLDGTYGMVARTEQLKVDGRVWAEDYPVNEAFEGRYSDLLEMVQFN